MHWAILDTGVYIGHWEAGLYDALLSDIRKGFVVRHSAVVLSELRRGVRSPAAQRRVEGLFRLAPIVWEPKAADWWEAGKLVREVGDREGWEVNKRREFQNDALIALTARRHGATVVTTNHADFFLLKRQLNIGVLCP
ncbi:MAG: type II toxin-antitoxin system VapC family toxin [Deltaproteobacteria bacterium]|nr:type II toxin-antitoxin system VapC family toxin [Deltaproteobacteria bacterium]